MKIYIAGTIHDHRLQTVYNELVGLGFTVVSRWHLPGNWQSETKQESRESRLTIADMNREDLLKADAVLALPCPEHHLRGMHYEIGFAHGKGMAVYVLGVHTDLNTMTLHETRTLYFPTVPSLPGRPV